MSRQVAFILVVGMLLALCVCGSAFAACTCYVDGQITLAQGCTSTTIRLWVWEIVNIETGEEDWVLEGEKTLGNLQHFHFVVQCAWGDCDAPAKIKSRGDDLVCFNLPGRDETLDLGVVHDWHSCSRKLESAIPPPMP